MKLEIYEETRFLASQVEAAATFTINLHTLAKKYRNIRNDIQPVIEQLQHGEFPGDRISGIEYEVFKLRVRNSDVQKGKSGGYRLLYYVRTATGIILLKFTQNLNKLILQQMKLEALLLSTNNAQLKQRLKNKSNHRRLLFSVKSMAGRDTASITFVSKSKISAAVSLPCGKLQINGG